MLSMEPSAATACFYRHLFRIAPDAKDLFVTDMRRQGAKLAETLQVIVNQLNRWGLLRTGLEDLAERHLAYGVLPQHYDAVGQAIQGMFVERLGAEFTVEMAEAWRKAYGYIQATMIAFAYPESRDGSTSQ